MDKWMLGSPRWPSLNANPFLIGSDQFHNSCIPYCVKKNCIRVLVISFSINFVFLMVFHWCYNSAFIAAIRYKLFVLSSRLAHLSV